MTREEIKDELYRMLSDVVNGGYPKRNNTQRGRYREAVKKAIEALEQEPELRQALEMEKGAYNALVKNLQCSDCISRQAAIDELYKMLHDCFGADDEELDAVITTLNELPPVTPAEKVGQWEWNQYDGNPKIGNWHCSQCHGIGKSYYDYCPYCKAKMLTSPTGAERSEE